MNIERAVLGFGEVNEQKSKENVDKISKEVHVYGVGVVSSLPDMCKIVISISSQKNDAPSAKNSVCKRLDYVIQAIQNHKFNNSEIRVSKTLTREKDQFCYSVIITLTSNKLDMVEELCNFLVEKLERMVTIETPRLFHSNEHLEIARRTAALKALANARQKASEMAGQVGLVLGNPILLREEQEQCNTESQVIPDEEQSVPKRDAVSWRGDAEANRVLVQARVMTVFEMRRKKER